MDIFHFRPIATFQRSNVVLLLLFALLSSCNDDDGINQVPIVPFDLTISLDLPLYSSLQSPGGWVYLEGGSRGIVVYRIDATQFAAFDRHCTYQVQEACRINVDPETNITAVDTECCNSEFTLLDGLPQSGPARRPLRRLQAMYNVNNNTLRVFN